MLGNILCKHIYPYRFLSITAVYNRNRNCFITLFAHVNKNTFIQYP